MAQQFWALVIGLTSAYSIAMAVYIDDAMIPFHGMRMNHMLADSEEELLAMATKIGMDHKWLQKAGTHQVHFDVSAERRTIALSYGAIAITYKEAGRITYQRRKTAEAQLKVAAE